MKNKKKEQTEKIEEKIEEKKEKEENALDLEEITIDSKTFVVWESTPFSFLINPITLDSYIFMDTAASYLGVSQAEIFEFMSLNIVKKEYFAITLQNGVSDLLLKPEVFEQLLYYFRSDQSERLRKNGIKNFILEMANYPIDEKKENADNT